MEEERKPERDLILVVFLVIILGVAWLVTGGAERFSAPGGPFLKKIPGPPGDLSIFNKGGSSDSSNNTGSNSGGNTGGAGYKIYFSSGNAKSTDVNKEYIEIRTSGNSAPANITGWTVEDKSKFSLAIPKAVDVFLSGKINKEQDVILEPNSKAIITTGRSPVGASFRLDKCSGYLEQSQDFYPSINEKCPRPKDENWPQNLSGQCLDYIKTLPRCRANFSIPPALGDECVRAINNTLTYNRCVELHQNDSDFFENEWRVFLGRDNEMWGEKYETITLRDKSGNVVETVSY